MVPMTTEPTAPQPAQPAMAARAPRSRGARRFGYIVAIVVNALILWVANNLLAWEWPKFLTSEFNQVLPYINASLLITMIVNAVWLLFDPPWFRSLAQVGLNLIAILATVKLYQVFPFDFSDYPGNLETVARILMGLAIVASGIAILSQVFKLFRRSASPA
jgi:hypothetical protein